MHIILVSLCLGLAAMSRGERPCYDHQKETYRAEYRPADCTQACTVTPFFSPDHSIDAYMQLIDGAEESIDLLEPSNLQHAQYHNFFCVHPHASLAAASKQFAFFTQLYIV